MIIIIVIADPSWWNRQFLAAWKEASSETELYRLHGECLVQLHEHDTGLEDQSAEVPSSR